MDDLSLEKDRPKDKAKYLNATLEEFHNLGYYEMFVEVWVLDIFANIIAIANEN